MGEGGNINLVNGTPYQWRQTYVHSYQMNSWNFPSTIAPGTVASVYVEWNQGVFNNQSDDGGELTYSLDGTPYSFQVQARAPNGNFTLQVFLQAMATQNNPQGSTIPLGWIHNGSVNFVLSGSFVSNNPPTAWMQSNISTLGNRSLRHLCIPGSHDAGMSTRNAGTAGAFDCNCLTQTLSIGGQLGVGSRYFDIRPVISGGKYYTGHYSHLLNDSTWQGANGQSIQDIINDINNFAVNNRELIILNLSHELNTDVGNNSYRSFNQDEWNGLFQLLSTVQHLFVAPNPTSVDLTTLTLNQFIGSGQAAVVVVVQPGGSGITLGNYANSGFYNYSQLNAYNNYSDTNEANTMVNGQLQELRTQRPNPDAGYFLLSWTLTQDTTEATTCFLGTASSIIQLANTANPLLYSKLLPACSSQVYPNILYIDAMNNSQIVPMAMAINQLGSTSSLQATAPPVPGPVSIPVPALGDGEILIKVVGMTSYPTEGKPGTAVVNGSASGTVASPTLVAWGFAGDVVAVGKNTGNQGLKAGDAISGFVRPSTD